MSAHLSGSEGALARDHEFIMHTYARKPVVFVRGEGTQLWDADGKRYLDFLCGLAVTSIGHAHPAVADALADQARKLLHVSNYFVNEQAPRLAERLDGLVGGGGRVFFANSGAEASEGAIKLARRYGKRMGGPKRVEIITAYASFHGRTLAALAATGQPEKHEPFQPLPPGFRHVALGDIDVMAAAIDDRVAAVMLEPVQGEGGVHVASREYLRSVRQLCDEREVLLIFDEVQTGLGRTGKWFGFQHAGISADVVTMAKALGNGMPIGAIWARQDVADAFGPGDHGSTFGGQPLSARAANAVLDVMEREDVCARAVAAGDVLRAGLSQLDHVASVRGQGLLLAAELADGVSAAATADRCLQLGLVVNAVTPTALRLAPPLLVSDDEIREALLIMERALTQVDT